MAVGLQIVYLRSRPYADDVHSEVSPDCRDSNGFPKLENVLTKLAAPARDIFLGEAIKGAERIIPRSEKPNVRIPLTDSREDLITDLNGYY